MFGRNRSLLAIAGVCALGVGLAPNASGAQGAQRAGFESAWNAPHARAVFLTEPVGQTLHGTIHRLGTLGGHNSAAQDVEGQIVVGRADTADGDSHAFVYDLAAARPRMVDLGTLGGPTSSASAISGHVVVGSADTASGGSHAFAYDLAASRPHMVDLGVEGAATAIDDGVVIGDSARASGGAFAYDLKAASPRMIDLGMLGGHGIGGHSTATDVDARVVTGWSTDNNLDAAPFAYDLDAPTPTMRNLGQLKGGSEAFAKAIDGNLVVGRGATRLPDSFHFHAFLADLGESGARVRDLGDLTAHGTGDSDATAVDGNIVVGGATRGRSLEAQWAFAEDLSTPDPVMRSLGSLGGHTEDTATDVDGDIVVGRASIIGTLNAHAFAYDLGAATPRMSDLGPAFFQDDVTGRPSSNPIRVSGNVVAGTQMVGGFERARAWTLATTTAPALRFAKTKTFVRENAGHATVTVVRDGDTSAAVTVRYGTRDIGGATSGSDFTPTRGPLSFAAGQTKATFRVPIVNDTRREGRERFLVRLLSPSAGAITGTPRAAAVVILSSDR